jgi:hypothetical protein
MSLAALAVVSRRSGKPLYMRSFVASSDLLFGQYGQNDTVGADFFGDILVEESLTQKSEWHCETKYEFMLNAASDRLDEILAEGKWKKPGAAGADACWVGLLCSMDSFNAYGYVTTNANYVTIVEDGIAPENVQLQKSRDNELKILLVSSFPISPLVLIVLSLPKALNDTLFLPAELRTSSLYRVTPQSFYKH